MGWAEVNGQTGVTQVWFLILAPKALLLIGLWFSSQLCLKTINRRLFTDVISISIVKIFIQVQWKLEIYIMVSSLF